MPHFLYVSTNLLSCCSVMVAAMISFNPSSPAPVSLTSSQQHHQQTGNARIVLLDRDEASSSPIMFTKKQQRGIASISTTMSICRPPFIPWYMFFKVLVWYFFQQYLALILWLVHNTQLVLCVLLTIPNFYSVIGTQYLCSTLWLFDNA